MKFHDSIYRGLPDCPCADPENCTDPVEGYRCQAGRVLVEDVEGYIDRLERIVFVLADQDVHADAADGVTVLEVLIKEAKRLCRNARLSPSFYEWVSVDSRLPEMQKIVLVFDEQYDESAPNWVMTTACRMPEYGGGWSWEADATQFHNNVTYWAELPSPPERPTCPDCGTEHGGDTCPICDNESAEYEQINDAEEEY